MSTKEKSHEYDDYEYEEISPRKQATAEYKKQLDQGSDRGKKHEKTTSEPEVKSTQPPEKTKVIEENEEEYYEAYDEVEEVNMTKDKLLNEEITSAKFKSEIIESTTEYAISTTTVKSLPTTRTTSASTTTTSTTTTTQKSLTSPVTEIYIGKLNEPLIRLVKRPFLPSRGGNPYSSRGLQPVGARALNNSFSTITQEFENRQSLNVKNNNSRPTNYPHINVSTQHDRSEDFKPSPQLMKTVPSQVYYVQNSNIPQTYIQTFPKSNPSENKYDTTITNESRNRVVSTIPVQYQVTGFSIPRDSYNINNIPQNRYNTNTNVATTSTFNTVYQNTPVRQSYQLIPSSNAREHFVHNNANFQRQPYSVINENVRPRQVQNTQTYFTRY